MTDLVKALPLDGDASEPDDLYAAFAEWVETRGITLYPAQDEAVLELVTGANVVLATPTGSGKSLVAVAAHYFALARGIRSVYTAPIKALVSEKFFALCEIFGSDRVGMMTGDAAVNPEAPILCCTAEVLANVALRTGAASDLGVVILDEFHFYADPDRGWAWQVPLLELARAQFLLMSATLGDTTELAEDLQRRTGRETRTVSAGERPVPLHHYYETTPLHETISDLLAGGQAPIYVVHFTQAAALEHAQALTSLNVADRAHRDQIAAAIGGFRVHRGLRQDTVPAGAPRHRRPPRRHAAEVPPAGRTARAGRPAEGHLRHRHPRRRHQRADPHRRVRRVEQVRRRAAAAAAGPRVPPDRRARRARRLRHRRHRRRPGAGARGRERQGGRQGRRRPQEAPQDQPEEAAGRVRVLEPEDPRAAARCGARGADAPVPGDARPWCSTSSHAPGTR